MTPKVGNSPSSSSSLSKSNFLISFLTATDLLTSFLAYLFFFLFFLFFFVSSSDSSCLNCFFPIIISPLHSKSFTLPIVLSSTFYSTTWFLFFLEELSTEFLVVLTSGRVGISLFHPRSPSPSHLYEKSSLKPDLNCLENNPCFFILLSS